MFLFKSLKMVLSFDWTIYSLQNIVDVCRNELYI